MSLTRNIIIVVIILLLLAIGSRQQLQLNELDNDIASLEKQLEEITYENEKRQNELDTPLDDQIEKYAKENGYRDPDAQYYYNDFSG